MCPTAFILYFSSQSSPILSYSCFSIVKAVTAHMTAMDAEEDGSEDDSEEDDSEEGEEEEMKETFLIPHDESADSDFFAF